MLRCLIFVVFLMTLFGTFVGINVIKKVGHQNAVINEYEFLLADQYSAYEDCKNQLGVFYVPRKAKK